MEISKRIEFTSLPSCLHPYLTILLSIRPTCSSWSTLGQRPSVGCYNSSKATIMQSLRSIFISYPLFLPWYRGSSSDAARSYTIRKNPQTHIPLQNHRNVASITALTSSLKFTLAHSLDGRSSSWRHFRVFEPQLQPTFSSFIIHPSINQSTLQLHIYVLSSVFAPPSAWYVVLRQILLLQLKSILRTRLRKCTLIATLLTYLSFFSCQK